MWQDVADFEHVQWVMTLSMTEKLSQQPVQRQEFAFHPFMQWPNYKRAKCLKDMNIKMLSLACEAKTTSLKASHCRLYVIT